MLRTVGSAAGGSPDRLRLYAPDDALLFSNLDARRPGYANAVALARAAGFEPVVRLAGGHAAVFLRESVAFAWATPDPEAHLSIQPRFERLTGWMVSALRELGLDARVGEVPGEYCPGEFSVNVGGRVKVLGVGQRVIRGAAHVGGVLTVGATDRLREVLVPIYEALDLPFAPDTAGGVADFEPGLSPDDVIDAIARAVARDGFDPQDATFEASVLQSAEALAPLHGPDRARGAGAALRPSRTAARGKALLQTDPRIGNADDEDS